MANFPIILSTLLVAATPYLISSEGGKIVSMKTFN